MIGAGHDLYPGVGLHLKINRKSFAYEGQPSAPNWCCAEYEKPQKAMRVIVVNLGRHYVACLAVLLGQRLGRGSQRALRRRDADANGQRKIGERPSSRALAAMCAADRSCDKGTEVSSAPRS